MEDKSIIHVVASQCQPEVEEKFNKWYDDIHVPMLMKFKGIKEVTRYERVYETEEYPKYLAIYKFESQDSFEVYGTSPELAAAREEMKETWKEGGFEVKWRVQYKPMKTWVR